MDWPFEGLVPGTYKVLLIDPPWDFVTFSAKGHGKTPHKHYNCMSLDDIKALPVRELAAPDCVMALWSTAPHMSRAMEVMAAWGFTYKTMGAWAKRSSTGKKWAFGTGYRYRSTVEPWLLGTRGSPPQRSRSIRNLIEAPVREHSRKPEQMHTDLQAAFDGPYAELFARSPTPGWSVWGNQVDRFPAAPALQAAE